MRAEGCCISAVAAISIGMPPSAAIPWPSSWINCQWTASSPLVDAPPRPLPEVRGKPSVQPCGSLPLYHSTTLPSIATRRMQYCRAGQSQQAGSHVARQSMRHPATTRGSTCSSRPPSVVECGEATPSACWAWGPAGRGRVCYSGVAAVEPAAVTTSRK